MNKYVKLVIAASAVLACSAVFAQQKDIKSDNGYAQDSRGNVLMSGTGLCVHTGYWTPADVKVEGCDGYVAPPPPPPPVAQAPAPAPAPAPKPAPVSEKVTFAADTTFDFNKAVLTNDGKSKLDDLASKLQGMNLEVVIAVGHTDRIGSDAYNDKLSVKRAEAVKAYLVSKGIEANRVYTEGKGKRVPVKECDKKLSRKKAIECLAPNRRVEVEVVGTRTKQ
jgi:OmpA-OmpF porin, OOP family